MAREGGEELTPVNGHQLGRATAEHNANIESEDGEQMFFFSPTLVGHIFYRGIVHLAVSWCGRAMESCLLFPGGLVSVVRSNGEDEQNTTVRELK